MRIQIKVGRLNISKIHTIAKIREMTPLSLSVSSSKQIYST